MTYSRDPRWLTARFASACSTCGKDIRTGDRIFYRPIGKYVYCNDCGDREYADFRTCNGEAF